MGFAACEPLTDPHGGTQEITNKSKSSSGKFIKVFSCIQFSMSPARRHHDSMRLNFDADGESGIVLLR